MTEVEPEFDVNERDDWYKLLEYESAMCPKCGNLRAVCSSPDGVHGDGFYPQRDVCFVSRARVAAERAFHEVHKDAEPSRATGWLTPADGWTIWAATEDFTPDDDFDGAFGPPELPPADA